MSRRLPAAKRWKRPGDGFAVCAVAVSLLLAPMADAVTVHTWIDGDGVRHFADAPPGKAVADPDQIVIPEIPVAEADARDDYYSIVNQWRRMREERKDRDALRLERERLEADARALAAATPDESPSYPTGYAVYPAYSPYGFGRGFGHSGRRGFDGYHGRRLPGYKARRRNAFVHATPRGGSRSTFFRR